MAFYAPPDHLAAAAAGQVIWSRRLTGTAALPDAAENLLVLYHSRTLAGQDTAVSGTISIPPGTPPADGIDDLLTPGLPPQLVPAEVFRPGTDLSPLLKILRANDPATLRLRIPTLTRLSGPVNEPHSFERDW